MGNLTLTFYPNDRKQSKRTNKIPIYVRLRKDRIKSEGRTNWTITPVERSKWNNTIERVEIKESKTNDFLNRIEDKFNEFKILHLHNLDQFDTKQIRDYILGRDPSKKKAHTIVEFVDEYYETNMALSARYSEGTKKNYLKAIRHLKKFLKYQKASNMRVSSVDYGFANKFTNYLMNDIPTLNKKGMSEVSACGIVKKFRTVFNQAVDEGVLESNPFGKIKLSYRSPEKPKLTMGQFKKFVRTYSLRETEIQYVHLFIFMSLTGTAFLDCQELTLDNLEQTPEGIKLIYKRNKTGHTSEQYLTKAVIELIELFDKRPDVQTSKFLVPQVSNQHFNRTLKLIGAKLGIPFNLTTHHGRHTYRGLLDEANIVDPTVIKKLMGWSNTGSMDGIYRQVTDSRLFKTKEQLEKIVSKL